MPKRSLAGVITCRTHCPHCGKPLNRHTVELFGIVKEVTDYASCGCEASKHDGEMEPRTPRLVKAAGIPAKFADADSDVSGWLDAVASGTSLYIHGPFGSGKTTFACSLLKRLADRGISGRFENAKGIVTEIQKSYNGMPTDVLERAYNCKVLVLDDLGKEQPTAFSISMLYELIDSRYRAGRPIVATSNFTRGELLRRWAEADAPTAESIVSRLCDGSETLYMGGSDRRLA